MNVELDERDEALQQAIDFIQQSAKRWHNRFTYKNLRFAERYLKGELEILVLFKEVGSGAEEFGALLKRIRCRRPDTDQHGWQILCPFSLSTDRGGTVEGERLVGVADRDQQAMLVDHVEPIDQPEVFAISSSVRLERADRLQELLGGGWHLSLRHGFEFFRGRDVVPAPDGKGHPRKVWRVGVGGEGEVVKARP